VATADVSGNDRQMSDYLSNLAVRSLSGEERSANREASAPRPTIRPRLASLFEPLLPVGRRQPEEAADADFRQLSLPDPVFEETEYEEQGGRLRPTRRPGSSPQYFEDERQRFLPSHNNESNRRSTEDWRSLLGLGNRETGQRHGEASIAKSDKDQGDREAARPAPITIQPASRTTGLSAARETPQSSEPIRPSIQSVERQTGERAVRDEGPQSPKQSSEPVKERPAVMHIIAPSVQLKAEPLAASALTAEKLRPTVPRQPEEHTVAAPVMRPAARAPESQNQSMSDSRAAKPQEQTEVWMRLGQNRYDLKRTSATEPILIYPRATVAVKPAGLERRETPDEPPAPVIQVTIRRIEVRANPPSVQQSTRRNGPATMSLDDYLKKRAKG
jgi:hypothetical protein